MTLAGGDWAQPYQLAVNGANVYWIDWIGPIWTVPVVGGTATMLSNGTNQGSDIAVDSSNEYWTANGPSGGVWKVSRTGGAVAEMSADTGAPRGVAVDATNIYWTDQESGKVNAMPIAGGAVRTLAVGVTPTEIAVDEHNLYWLDVHAPPPTADVTYSTVMAIPLAGGAPVTLATSAPRYAYDDIATDGVNVYWTDDERGVLKMPTGGGMATVLATATCPGKLAVDETYVYWVDNKGCSVTPTTTTDIMKVPIAGGQPTVLAHVQGQEVNDVAVDANSVYWTAGYYGESVMKLTPK